MSLILSKLSQFVSVNNKKEKFGECEGYEYEEDQTASFSMVDLLILLISCYAAYLSWSCNTVRNVEFLFKIIYASIAFFFGVMYVVFYGVFKETLLPCQ